MTEFIRHVAVVNPEHVREGTPLVRAIHGEGRPALPGAERQPEPEVVRFEPNGTIVAAMERFHYLLPDDGLRLNGDYEYKGLGDNYPDYNGVIRFAPDGRFAERNLLPLAANRLKSLGLRPPRVRPGNCPRYARPPTGTARRDEARCRRRTLGRADLSARRVLLRAPVGRWL